MKHILAILIGVACLAMCSLNAQTSTGSAPVLTPNVLQLAAPPAAPTTTQFSGILTQDKAQAALSLLLNGSGGQSVVVPAVLTVKNSSGVVQTIDVLKVVSINVTRVAGTGGAFVYRVSGTVQN